MTTTAGTVTIICFRDKVPDAACIMLGRMSQDVRSIVSTRDPVAQFTTPAPAKADGASSWLAKILPLLHEPSRRSRCFHGYIQQGSCLTACPLSEDVLILISHSGDSCRSLTRRVA